MILFFIFCWHPQLPGASLARKPCNNDRTTMSDSADLIMHHCFLFLRAFLLVFIFCVHCCFSLFFLLFCNAPRYCLIQLQGASTRTHALPWFESQSFRFAVAQQEQNGRVTCQCDCVDGCCHVDLLKDSHAQFCLHVHRSQGPSCKHV